MLPCPGEISLAMLHRANYKVRLRGLVFVNSGRIIHTFGESQEPDLTKASLAFNFRINASVASAIFSAENCSKAAARPC